MWLAAGLSALAGGLEAGTAYILGLVIDATIAVEPAAFFAPGNLALVGGALVFFTLCNFIPYAEPQYEEDVLVGAHLCVADSPRLPMVNSASADDFVN